jgi:hypothetical protein
MRSSRQQDRALRIDNKAAPFGQRPGHETHPFDVACGIVDAKAKGQAEVFDDLLIRTCRFRSDPLQT